MKREGIRRAPKGIVTFLLTVIIGILPTAEVWAKTFVINRDTTANTAFITIGSQTIYNGDDNIYVRAGDKIQASSIYSPFGGIGFYTDKTKNTKLQDEYGNDYVGGWDAGTTDTITAPAWGDFNGAGFPAVAASNQGWKVILDIDSGNVKEIIFIPIEVYKIKYYDNGTDISDIAANTNPYVFPSLYGDLDQDLEHALNPLAPVASFTGWYTDAGDKVTGIKVITDLQISGTSDALFNNPVASFIQNADGTYHLNARWAAPTPPAPTPGGGGNTDPAPEPDPYKITYYPDNVLNFPIEDKTYDLEIGLPKNTFRANPGQMFEGWQVADTEQDPVVGTGEIFKPGTVFKVKDGMAFIAVWKDNPTFKIESDEEYFLTPPENTINKLTSLIRMSSEITYYEDGEEPEEGDTEKEKKVYIKGTAIPSSQLEVVLDTIINKFTDMLYRYIPFSHTR